MTGCLSVSLLISIFFAIQPTDMKKTVMVIFFNMKPFARLWFSRFARFVVVLDCCMIAAGLGCSSAPVDDSCWARTVVVAVVVGGRRRPTGCASTARPTLRTAVR